MRLLWWRREKPKDANARPPAPAQERETLRQPLAAQHGGFLGRRRDTAAIPADALLAFAREYLLARDAHVRLDGSDVVEGTFSDGSLVRYTSSVARSSSERDLLLLTPGSAALRDLLDDCASAARLTSLRLAAACDPVAVIQALATQSAAACGACVASSRASASAPLAGCAECPLRAGEVVLRGLPVASRATVARQWESVGVELRYLVVGHDRQERIEDEAQLSFDVESQRPLLPLTTAQIGAARGMDVPAAAAATIETLSSLAQAALAPQLEAASVFLRSRASAEYGRRVDDALALAERLRRERPEESRDVQVSLKRELQSLSAVFAVSVEATLSSVSYIATPMVSIAVPIRGAAPVTLTVDVGRGHVVPPACAACGTLVTAGVVCDEWHCVCGGCSTVCVSCGSVRCQACAGDMYIPCATCGEAACGDCASACATCGATHCRAHVWRQADHTVVCIRCMEDPALVAPLGPQKKGRALRGA